MFQASHNALTSLTAWSHLWNLQYLDVSGNQLSSLRGFETLIHLRELKANHNQIESLDGIMKLDGLLRLQLRDNSVGSVSFEGSTLYDYLRSGLSDIANQTIASVSLISTLATTHLRAS